MKRLNLMLLVIGVAIIFSGCLKDDLLAPELSQTDQETSLLKSAKKSIPFSGICSFFAPGEAGTMKELPNGKLLEKGTTVVWYDDATDSLVTGKTTWYIKSKTEEDGAFKFWGKTTLIVDDDLGRWEMSWHGYLTLTAEGPVMIGVAVGQGKEGAVKGLVGKWTYTFDFTNGYYVFEGSYH